MAKNIRRDKVEYYLGIALSVATRATCLRRKYGAIIVQNDEIIATGYNGASRGCISCLERGICKRKELNIPAGERYELCISVHAEQNAIISASRRDMMGATLYLTGIDVETNKELESAEPCMLCRRFIMNSGISTVVMRKGKSYEIQEVSTWRVLENM